jgi:hypothetical protein
LTEEDAVGDIKKEKPSFTRDDFIDLGLSMWTRDIPIFMHGHLKMFILFAPQVFLFRGARIGAFIPDAEYRKKRVL